MLLSASGQKAMHITYYIVYFDYLNNSITTKQKQSTIYVLAGKKFRIFALTASR
jgi:hypothetical protein